MRKLWWMVFFVLVLGFAMPVRAQDYSPFEAEAGYSFLHVTCCGSSHNWNGGNGELFYNVSNLLAVGGDFAGYTSSEGGATVNLVTYQFGPRVYFSRGLIRPFAQVLLGGIHASASLAGVGSGSNNGFNVDVGGGVDLTVNDHFAVRPAQLSYEHAHFSQNGGSGFDNFRYSAGVVFRF